MLLFGFLFLGLRLIGSLSVFSIFAFSALLGGAIYFFGAVGGIC